MQLSISSMLITCNNVYNQVQVMVNLVAEWVLQQQNYYTNELKITGNGYYQ